jgi:protein O-mannosyl-transferase
MAVSFGPATLSRVRRILIMIAGLIVLTVGVYWHVYRFPFIKYDDPDYVYGNAELWSGFSAHALRYAFTSYRGGNWNPLLWISFFVDRAMFALRPGAMHVENVAWHLIGGLLLWWFLRLATGSVYRSYVVAGLFLCHPMHVESVVWITERKDVLSTPLLIGAMIGYVMFTQGRGNNNRWLAYIAMLLFFAASLLVKTMGITLPAVLLLMDVWPLKRWPGRSWGYLVAEKIPLAVMSLAMGVVGTGAQHHVGANTSLAGLSLVNRLDNAVVCYVLYVTKLIAPSNLAVLYPHPGERPAAAVLISLLLLLMNSVFLWRIRGRFPYALIGWLWFLGTLVPVIGLYQIGSQAMADRYSYFPSIGLFILLVWGGHDLFNRVVPPRPDRRRSMWVQATAGSAVLIAFTILGHIQVGYWRDSEALFRHDLAIAGDNAPAHTVLASVYGERGDIKGAVDELNAALKLGPNARASYTLGNCWKIDDPDRAQRYYRQAVELGPYTVDYHVAYADSLLKSGDKTGAAEQIHQALVLDATDPGANAELKKLQGGGPR